MPSAFTHYWSESTVFEEGGIFDHTAGNRFSPSGVTTGDRVFGISVRRGVPILVGRMIVSRPPVNFEEACELLPYEPWEADEHLIALAGSASLQLSSREIPVEMLRQLRFESATGVTALKFISDTRLDQQTFRGFRRLVPESAELLESLIQPDEFIAAEPTEATYPDEIAPDRAYFDGAVQRVLINRYERDPAARKACLAEYGCVCIVCDIDFADWYGDRGAGFIHVHHVTPISQLGADYRIDPIADLVPVCPNCHAMLHRDSPVSVQQLQEIYSHHLEQISNQQEG